MEKAGEGTSAFRGVVSQGRQYRKHVSDPCNGSLVVVASAACFFASYEGTKALMAGVVPDEYAVVREMTAGSVAEMVRRGPHVCVCVCVRACV